MGLPGTLETLIVKLSRNIRFEDFRLVPRQGDLDWAERPMQHDKDLF